MRSTVATLTKPDAEARIDETTLCGIGGAQLHPQMSAEAVGPDATR